MGKGREPVQRRRQARADADGQGGNFGGGRGEWAFWYLLVGQGHTEAL
jgi:hypothetical protein